MLHGTLYSTGMHSTYLNTLEAVDRERLYASFTGKDTPPRAFVVFTNEYFSDSLLSFLTIKAFPEKILSLKEFAKKALL